MVSDVITAEGFDQTGSREDQPQFDSCDPDITYQHGIGRDYFYRVAYRNRVQIDRLAAVVTARPDFIMVPTGGSDPYTCTALPMVQRRFGGDVTEVKFDADESSTVLQTARRICGTAKDVTVVYIARGSDLARLLFSLDEAFGSGQCAATSVAVVSTSDGQRLRAVEDNPMLEDLRVRAVRSASFATGKVRLLTTLVSGADKKRPDNPGFADLEESFTGAGFDLADIDDGWAVNAYDSTVTVSEALRTLPAAKPVQRSQVNTAISGFSAAGQAVRGAGGMITFDNSGNRADSRPARGPGLSPATGDRIPPGPHDKRAAWARETRRPADRGRAAGFPCGGTTGYAGPPLTAPRTRWPWPPRPGDRPGSRRSPARRRSAPPCRASPQPGGSRRGCAPGSTVRESWSNWCRNSSASGMRPVRWAAVTALANSSRVSSLVSARCPPSISSFRSST